MTGRNGTPSVAEEHSRISRVANAERLAEGEKLNAISVGLSTRSAASQNGLNQPAETNGLAQLK